MSDDRTSSKEQAARLDELKERIERASELIGELRETNYSLTTEIVELKNRLAAGEDNPSRPPSKKGSGSAASDANDDDNRLTEEVELLRAEREAVRKKLESLVVRIEKLES